MAKKKTRTRDRVRTKRAEKKPAKAKKPRTEFLVLRIAKTTKVGGTVSLVAVASSQAEAEEKVKAISSPSPARLAIVEKKLVLERKPKISVEPIDENIVAN